MGVPATVHVVEEAEGGCLNVSPSAKTRPEILAPHAGGGGRHWVVCHKSECSGSNTLTGGPWVRSLASPCLSFLIRETGTLLPQRVAARLKLNSGMTCLSSDTKDMSIRPPSAVSQKDALGALPVTQLHFGWGQGTGKGRGWSQRSRSLPAGEPAGGLRPLPCKVGLKIPSDQG